MSVFVMWVSLGISILLGAMGQIFMKEGMKAAGPIALDQGFHSLFLYYFHVFLSPFILATVVCYGISILLWLAVLSRADLTLIRPLMSIGYILTMAYGYYAGEHLTPGRIFGTLLIIAGLYFVARSGVRT